MAASFHVSNMGNGPQTKSRSWTSTIRRFPSCSTTIFTVLPTAPPHPLAHLRQNQLRRRHSIDLQQPVALLNSRNVRRPTRHHIHRKEALSILPHPHTGAVVAIHTRKILTLFQHHLPPRIVERHHESHQDIRPNQPCHSRRRRRTRRLRRQPHHRPLHVEPANRKVLRPHQQRTNRPTDPPSRNPLNMSSVFLPQ